LIKGIDPNIVTAVVRELQSAKLPAAVTGAAPTVPAGTAAAPAAPPVPLPGALPLPPPPPPATAVADVPASSPPAAVPVPPVPAPGGVPASGSGYKALVDKIIAARNAGKITPEKVNEVVQAEGAPSLMALASLPDLIDKVNTRLDLALSGLA
jgi:hypothetical protein